MASGMLRALARRDIDGVIADAVTGDDAEPVALGDRLRRHRLRAEQHGVRFGDEGCVESSETSSISR